MAFDAKVFRVMIASPGAVVVERNTVREVLAEWNAINADARRTVLLPVGWETHSSPEMGDRAQEFINKQVLQDADLLLGVFWTRIGTATGDYASGTVEEIEEHLATGKPAMLYFSSAPVHPDSVDAKQYAALKEFKEQCKSRGLLESYSNKNEFRDKFYRQLQLKLNQDSYFKVAEVAPADSPVISSGSVRSVPLLSTEAQTLIKEASASPDGVIMRIAYIGGLSIQTNGKNFIQDGNPRTRALWEGALEELQRASLIITSDSRGYVFRVTREGYETAELLKS